MPDERGSAQGSHWEPPKVPKQRTTSMTAKELRTPQEEAADQALRARIAERAYELHVMRGHREGHALDDWLEAEREIMSRLPPV